MVLWCRGAVPSGPSSLSPSLALHFVSQFSLFHLDFYCAGAYLGVVIVVVGALVPVVVVVVVVVAVGAAIDRRAQHFLFLATADSFSSGPPLKRRTKWRVLSFCMPWQRLVLEILNN